MFCNLLQAMPEAWSYASPEKVAHARGGTCTPPHPQLHQKNVKIVHIQKRVYGLLVYITNLSTNYIGADPEFSWRGGGGGGARKRLLCANAHNEREIRSPFRQGSIPLYFKHSDTLYYKNHSRSNFGGGGGGGWPVAPLDPPAWTTKQKQTWTKILNQNHDMQYL